MVAKDVIIRAIVALNSGVCNQAIIMYLVSLGGHKRGE